jgi:hypothetical protein
MMPNFSITTVFKPILRLILIAFLLTCGFPKLGLSQTDSAKKPTPCVQKDLPGLYREWRNKPPKKNVQKNHSLLFIPTVAINPTSGFMVGAAAQYITRDKQPKSLYSFVQGSVFVTTKKHLLFQVKSNVYTDQDKILLSGDWRFFIFSQPTYGLGTNAPQGGVLHRRYNINGIPTNDDSLVQPMKFNHVRFYQTISKRIRSSQFYAGVGYHLDYYYGIQDLRLDTAAEMITSHYAYNKAYGFSQTKYAVSGVSVNFSGDTRDNIVNASKGHYFNASFRVNPEFLGSAGNSTLLGLEWRSFHQLSKKDTRKILAFWAMGNFSSAGKLPYLALPALGYDQRGKAGRGYTQGRFRGPNMIYAESEYRFPLSRCGGILGGVVFANITTADNPGKTVRLFDNIASGVGCGLRIMVDKLSKTNVAIDFGVGRKSVGVYLGVAETF